MFGRNPPGKVTDASGEPRGVSSMRRHVREMSKRECHLKTSLGVGHPLR